MPLQAFDRVEYCTLFTRLLFRALPPISLLECNEICMLIMLLELNGIVFAVRFSQFIIKQGGIVSHVLFSVLL